MKKQNNKLLIALTFIGLSSQMINADGFFHSVGNVATLGELDRSEKRQADEERKSKKNKKEQKKSTSKKSKKKRKED